VRHFVSDDVTPEMVAPVISAWNETDGHLPAIYKALIRVVYEHTGTHKKFLNPEVWFLQSVKLGEAPWPPTPAEMTYDFKSKPRGKLNRPRSLMWEMGHHPYRPAQPNGWPDTEAEWLSPELLIRRLAVAREMSDRTRHNPAFSQSIARNFDSERGLIDYLKMCKGRASGAYSAARSDGIYLFPSEWMLKV
jgi:uncharacterized protein (DUF1800 family)